MLQFPKNLMVIMSRRAIEKAPNLEKKPVFNYEAIWKGYSELTSLEVDIQAHMRLTQDILLFSPILALAFFECGLLEFSGFANISEFMAKASNFVKADTIWPSLFFTLFMVIRILLPDSLIEACMMFWGKGEIEPIYRRVMDRKLWLAKTCYLLKEEQLANSVLKTHFSAIGKENLRRDRKTLMKEFVIQLSKSTPLCQEVLKALEKPRQKAVLLTGGLALLFTVLLFRHPLRAVSSFLLMSLHPLIKEVLGIFRIWQGNKATESLFAKVNRVFDQEGVQLKQAVYQADPSRKILNIFSLQGPDETDENPLIDYIRSQQAFVVFVFPEKGVIFKVVKPELLDDLKPMQFNFQKKIRVLKIEEEKPEEENEFVYMEEERASKPNPVVRGRRKNREGLSLAGKVIVDPFNSKQPIPKTVEKPEKSPPVPPNELEWIKKFNRAADEILKINGSSFIFIYGSAMEGYRNQYQVQTGEDIDLLIVIPKGSLFLLPVQFKLLAEPNNEYNNLSCSYDGVKIDITCSDEEVAVACRKFRAKNDLSSTRDMISYGDVFPFMPSKHTRMCQEMKILSTIPRPAKELFSNDPYCIFRILGAILSGNNRVDLNLYEALNDVPFCRLHSQELTPKRIFTGLNKLFTKGHPALVLRELEKFGWFRQYFPDANELYDLTLSRVTHIFSAPVTREVKLILVYSVLLWPSFEKDEFYNTHPDHFFRMQTFFKLKKLRDRISFPGEKILNFRKSQNPLFIPPKNPNLFVIQDHQKSTDQDFGLQVKISLLFFWLSRDLNKLDDSREPEKNFFHPDLISSLSLCYPILLEAVQAPLVKVDFQALLKKSLPFWNKGPKEDIEYKTVGVVKNYFI